MKYGKRITACLAVAAVLCWSVMFGMDYSRSIHLEKPVFARPVSAPDANGRRTYRGIGYRVEVREREVPPGSSIEAVEMWMFDRVVAASIT